MSKIVEGEIAPAFTLQNEDGNQVALKTFKGQWVVLYFYPKDMTSGCTQQACDFTETMPKFKKTDAVILGVSKDSVSSHKKFKEKYNLNFSLLADEDVSVCKSFGVYKKKSLYGREYMGIERTTFIIDPKGKIAKIFPKVKVKGHVESVLAELRELRK